MSLPSKRHYRQRAHSNPIADHHINYSVRPEEVLWDNIYPHYKQKCNGCDSETKNVVEFLDVGCGFGGLLVSLSELYPNTLILGMEIRVKVCEYTQKRILGLQEMHNYEQFHNIACIRTNAMKYLPNYFKKGQLKKLFFLFPDPHFKAKKYKWRIINNGLLDEYAYALAKLGIVYTVTDVEDLYEWMVNHFEKHPLFSRISDEQLEIDPMIKLILECTEEAKKVEREGRGKFYAAFQRIPDPWQN